jgi:molecular chaperone GrpE
MTAASEDRNKEQDQVEGSEQSEEDAVEQEQAAPAGPPEKDPAAEVAELKDKLLRALAEGENVRRRAERDRQEISQYAIVGFARDLLAVSDNLRRALEHAPAPDGESAAVKLLLEGVDLTEKELLRVLTKHGVKRIEPAIGDKFDHNFHQAMFEVPTNDQPKGAIVQVMQAGYVLHDRLLRPAMVGIAKPLAGDEGPRVDQKV